MKILWNNMTSWIKVIGGILLCAVRYHKFPIVVHDPQVNMDYRWCNRCGQAFVRDAGASGPGIESIKPSRWYRCKHRDSQVPCEITTFYPQDIAIYSDTTVVYVVEGEVNDTVKGLAGYEDPME